MLRRKEGGDSMKFEDLDWEDKKCISMLRVIAHMLEETGNLGELQYDHIGLAALIEDAAEKVEEYLTKEPD
jgi:hypothetical protein